MNCTEFEQLLDEGVVSRELHAAARTTLKSHADGCSACCSKWDDFVLLDDVIPRWNSAFNAAVEHDPIDLADSVMFALASEVAASDDGVAETSAPTPVVRASPAVDPPQTSRKTGVLLTAICASALVALVVFSLREQPEKDVREIAKSEMPAEPDETERVAIEAAPPMDELLADAGSAYRLVANDTATIWSDGASLFKPETIRLSPATETHEPSAVRVMAEDIPGRLERFGQGFKPISSGVSSATGFLFNVIPLSDAPQI